MIRYSEVLNKKKRPEVTSNNQPSSISLMNKIIEKKSFIANGEASQKPSPVDEEETVKVIVRIRPNIHQDHNRKPQQLQTENCLKVFDKKSVEICNPVLIKMNKESYWKSFKFNSVIPENSTNSETFKECIKPHLPNLLQGFNLSVLCYGVTGSGKTHTMFGEEGDRGIVFECAEWILSTKDSLGRGSGPNRVHKMQIEASIYEIYNENVRDLSFPQPINLTVCEDSKKDVWIKDLFKMNITSVEELRFFLETGNSRRVKASTNNNIHSSRSHAIVELNVNTLMLIDGKPDHHVMASKLMMVDLAGSERLSPGEESQADQLLLRKNEGSKINKSLLSLTNCILNLGDQKQFTNFRDSKLTRILKTSLCGNSKTMMIGCVSKSCADFENTFNTLQYCSKAAFIKKKNKANIVVKSAKEIENILEKAKPAPFCSKPPPQTIIPSPSSKYFANRGFSEKSKLKKLISSHKKNQPPDHSSCYNDIKSALKSAQEIPQLIELMKTMINRKKKLEEDFRSGEVKNTEYFYSVATYNELSLVILGQMDAKESTATNSVLFQKTASNQNLSNSQRQIRQGTRSINDDSDLKKRMKSYKETFLLSQIQLRGFNNSWSKRLKNSMITRKAPNASLVAAQKSRSPDLFSKTRGSFFQSDDALKLKMARQSYRNFKNEIKVVHSMKRSINSQNPRETFEVAYKIESLLKTQKDNRFLLTKSQDLMVSELKDFLKKNDTASSNRTTKINF